MRQASPSVSGRVAPSLCAIGAAGNVGGPQWKRPKGTVCTARGKKRCDARSIGSGRNNVQAFWGELLGMMTLILLGNGVVAGVSLKGSYAENGGWMVIAT